MISGDTANIPREAGAGYLHTGHKVDPNYYQWRLEAIKITIPHFKEEDIHTYALTANEFQLIQGLAIYYALGEDYPKAIGIYQQLWESISKTHVGVPKLNTSALFNNHSHNLCKLEQFDNALEIAAAGKKICMRNNTFKLLPNYAVTDALCHFGLGNKEKSLAYAAMAYYSACITEHPAIKAHMGKFAYENFGIKFIGV